jgi:RNA polymerase sigma factor
MQFTAINARIEGIREDPDALNRFVEEYKPFIAACAEKVAGRYVTYGRDDELSIAMIAFVEAINSFNQSRGNFFSFSRNVIKRRLIDYYRSEQRHSKVISLNVYTADQDEEFDLSLGESVRKYSDREIAEIRKFELEELGKELSEWKISFSDLAGASPRHEKTKKQCIEIVGLILSRPEMLHSIMTKKYLPVAEIEKDMKLPRKLIERFRKYIIAVVIIATGDYEYIRDYIKL